MYNKCWSFLFPISQSLEVILAFIWWTPKNPLDRNPSPCSIPCYRSFQANPQNNHRYFLPSSYRSLALGGWYPDSEDFAVDLKQFKYLIPYLFKGFALHLCGCSSLRKCSIRYTFCWGQNKGSTFWCISFSCMCNTQNRTYLFEPWLFYLF